MLEGVLGSVVAKVLAVVLGIAGVAGGMAAAGVLPGVPGLGGNEPEVEASATTPVGSASVSTSSAAPVDLTGLPVGSEAADVMALVGQAQAAADGAKAVATKCLDTATTQVSSLIATVTGLTDPAQVQALVGKVTAIGNEAQKCAGEAKLLGKSAVDQAAAATQAANALDITGLGDLGGLTNPEDIIGQILAAALGAGDTAAGVEDMVLGIVNQIITTIGRLLPAGLGEGGLPLPLPGTGEGGLPLPLPGLGEGGLPLPGLGEGGLPIPGLGEGGLPLPGLGEGGLPIPGLGGGTLPGLGEGNPIDLATQLVGTILNTVNGLKGTLPVPLPTP